MVTAIKRKIEELINRSSPKKEFKKIQGLVEETINLGMTAARLSRVRLILEANQLKKEVQTKNLEEVLPKPLPWFGRVLSGP